MSYSMMNAQTIDVTAGGTPIPLDTSNFSSAAFTPNANPATYFTVNETGCYLVSYDVNLTTPTNDNTAIYVNGVAVPGTVQAPDNNNSSFFSNTSVICLNAGDTVQLTMYGGTTPVTMTNNSGANLTLTQIS